MSTSEVVIHPKKFYLSPSALSQYFFHECERSLLFSISSVGKASWNYVKDGKYIPFEANENIELEISYIYGECDVDSETHEYFKDGESYKVVRGLWYHKKSNEDDEWIPLDHNTSILLENAYRENKKSIEIEIDGNKKTIQLGKDETIKRYNPNKGNLSAKDQIKDLIFERGFSWERQILDLLEENNHFVYKEDEGNIEYEKFIDILMNVEEIKKFLDEGKRVFIYQASLIVEKSLLDEFELDEDRYSFSTCYPDFLEIKYNNEPSGKKLSIHVIDAKSTEEIHPTHYSQISFYTIFLTEMLKNNPKLNENYIISKSCGVWLHNKDEYTSINVENCEEIMKRFMKESSIFRKHISEAKCRLSSACKGCPYISYCKEKEKDDVTMIYGCNNDNKDVLSKYFKDNLSIEDIYTFITEEPFKGKSVLDSKDEDDISPSTPIKKSNSSLSDSSNIVLSPSSPNYSTPTKSLYPNMVPESPSDYPEVPPTPSTTNYFEPLPVLQENDGIKLTLMRIKAYKENKIMYSGLPSVLHHEEDAIVMIRMIKSIYNDILAWSITIKWLDGETPDEKRFKQNDKFKKSEREMIVEFVENLHSCLEMMVGKVISIYTYTKYERIMIHNLLEQSIKIEEIAPKGRKLLSTLFNSTRNDFVDVYPNNLRDKYPIIPIEKLLNKLLLLPLDFDASFEEICKLIAKEVDYKEEIVDTQVELLKWYKDEIDDLSPLMSSLTDQSYMIYKYIVNTVSQQKSILYRTPRCFKFREELGTTLVDKLNHFVQLEFYKRCKVGNNHRLSILADSLDQISDTIPYISYVESFEDKRGAQRLVFNVISISDHLLSRTLKNSEPYLLIPATKDGVKEATQFDNYAAKFFSNSRAKHCICISGKDIVYLSKDKIEIRLTPTPLKLFKHKGHYFLSPLEFHHTYQTVSTQLSRAKEIESLQLFMKDPLEWAKMPLNFDHDVYDKAMEIYDEMKKNKFTDKQFQLFDKIFKNKLQWIIGPPGSGKTFFISMFLSIIANAHKDLDDREFRVLITCNTHKAIDNILLQLKKIEEERFLTKEERLATIRLGINSSSFKSIKNTWDNELYPTVKDAMLLFGINMNQTVTGSTVYKIYGIKELNHKYDMIVIDEASQLLLRDVLPLFSTLKEDGRLVVIGDHNQLPPITNIEINNLDAKYYGSIFDFIRLSDPEMIYGGFLRENWRMNDTILHIPSKYLYTIKGEAYLSANDNVSNQSFFVKKTDEEQLRLGTSENYISLKEQNMVKLLDGLKPLIVFLIKDDENSKVKSPHANIIACTTNIMRYLALRMYPDENDEDFWDKRLLIAAPHHTQIRKIKDAFEDKDKPWHYKWLFEPNVDTIEKSQGRQFDVTIFDYAIFDSDQINKEVKFLYDLNRINVALTRARMKNIIFISENILMMHPKILKNERFCKSLNYLHRYVEYAKEQDSLISMTLEELNRMEESLELENYSELKVDLNNESEI